MKNATRLLSILLMCLAALYGQSERGSIRGTVEDSTGAVVPGAKVSATSVATNVETATRSGDAGNYNIPGLAPGIYRVQVEQSGFKKLIRENVVVEVSGVT